MNPTSNPDDLRKSGLQSQPLSDALAQAITETLREACHNPGCDYRMHFSHLHRFRSAKKWAAAREDAMRDAPPCSCWLGRLSVASGIPLPSEE